MKSIDPTVTQEFLMAQEYVLDASVWMESGRLKGQVTVEGREKISASYLLEKCRSELGLVQSLEELIVFEADKRLFLV